MTSGDFIDLLQMTRIRRENEDNEGFRPTSHFLVFYSNKNYENNSPIYYT